MTARFDALQDQLLTLYESAATDIHSQIKHWELSRKLNVLMYYSRKEGYSNLGLQTLPTLQVSEYNAKLAIKMMILLKSLANSRYGKEQWSLTETSAELMLTPPKNTFKKGGFQVEVFYDNDRFNANVYTQWEYIYYQDLNDEWHKVPGEVDHNGLSFTDVTGEKTYFKLFAEDAERYSDTGQWTVRYKNTTISSVVTSSSRQHSSINEKRDQQRRLRDSSPEEGTSRRSEKHTEEELPTTTTTSPTTTRERRRRRRGDGGEQQQGESSTGGPQSKRVRGSFAVSADEVGTRHRSVPAHGLGRLRRLQEEARDPPILCIKGPANNLKCWRNRFNVKFNSLYFKTSSVFKWLGDTDSQNNISRMLIAFHDQCERTRFLQTVNLPKGTSFSFGSLDSL